MYVLFFGKYRLMKVKGHLVHGVVRGLFEDAYYNTQMGECARSIQGCGLNKGAD